MATTRAWLLPEKVRLPERPPFQIEREKLFVSIAGSRWNTLIVQAPAGFGKTNLLAELCRRERDRGVVAAWFAVDEDDSWQSIAPYLVRALDDAGLPIGDALLENDNRPQLLATEIGRSGLPCLLALDSVECLQDSALDALNHFMQVAPPNLRIALGLRRNPGLDLSTLVLDGRAVEFGPASLRFSRAEISAYFGGGLRQRELGELAETTEGWPIALSLLRYNRSKGGEGGLSDHADGGLMPHEGIVADWLRYRLFQSMASADYEFLLDLAQFDWIDAEVVNAVLNRRDSGRRIADLEMLDGFAQPVEGKPGKLRLHSLIKGYCVVELQQRNPNRYRDLHRSITGAMYERGHLLSALLHAAETGDVAILGDLMMKAGGLRLFLHEGWVGLGPAFDLLTEKVTDQYPRLALLRCRAFVYEAKLVEARRLFERTRLLTADLTRDRLGGDDQALVAEGNYVRAVLNRYSCLPFNDDLSDELVDSHMLVKGAAADPLFVASHALLVFADHQARAMFEHAVAYGREAEAVFLRLDSPHGLLHVHLNLGLAAMARGRDAEAADRYGRAAGIVEERFSGESSLRQVVNVLLGELELERNHMDRVRELVSTIPVPFRNGAAWLDVVVAAHDVIARWKFEIGGVESALRFLRSTRDTCESLGLVTAVRHLAALRMGYLVHDGRVDEAHRAWRRERLPEREEEILRLDNQTWREMEALADARLRLLIAADRLDAARDLAAHLSALAQERGLVRTLMRCLALSMALEHRADNIDAATVHYLDYLRRWSDTGFLRPLAHVPAAAQIIQDILARDGIDSELRSASEALLAQLAGTGQLAAPAISEREREVIECLGNGLRDKEIARELSISAHGVRYHLRNIYRKTGTSGRWETVRWAQGQGFF